jgi:hypothetical protein
VKKKKAARRARVGGFSTADWRDVYDLLWDAANVHHSGPRADRAVALATKIREEMIGD